MPGAGTKTATRVLIVSQYFWPENFRINDLTRGLVARGCKVSVLTGQPNYPGGRFFPDYGFFKNMRQDYHGAELFRVPVIPRFSGRGYQLIVNYFSFVISASLFALFLPLGKPDAIFVFETSPITVGLPALVIKRLTGAPILFWVQDLWPESLSATGAIRSPVLLKMVSRLVRFIYRWCDLILVQSRAFISSVKNQGVPCDRIVYYPNSAEEFYQPVAVEAGASERALLPEGFRVLFAGNIGAAQDFGTILDAAEILKTNREIKWIIVGDGRMRPWVEAEILRRQLTETVKLLDRQPEQRMPRYFALADVLLVVLKREPIFALTIPSKIQSYLACAKPIVAALDGEGARIIREAGAGLCCAAGEPAALAKTVLTMRNAPEIERRAMGENGRNYFDKEFAREKLLDQLRLLIDGAAMGDRSAREMIYE